jgi:hypothetical protein
LKNLKGRDYLGDLSVDGRITLECTLKVEGMRVWTVFVWLGAGISSELF